MNDNELKEFEKEMQKPLPVKPMNELSESDRAFIRMRNELERMMGKPLLNFNGPEIKNRPALSRAIFTILEQEEFRENDGMDVAALMLSNALRSGGVDVLDEDVNHLIRTLVYMLGDFQ